MADEALVKAGLYVDAYNKIRLLQPGNSQVRFFMKSNFRSYRYDTCDDL